MYKNRAQNISIYSKTLALRHLPVLASLSLPDACTIVNNLRERGYIAGMLNLWNSQGHLEKGQEQYRKNKPNWH